MKNKFILDVESLLKKIYVSDFDFNYKFSYNNIIPKGFYLNSIEDGNGWGDSIYGDGNGNCILDSLYTETGAGDEYGVEDGSGFGKGDISYHL